MHAYVCSQAAERVAFILAYGAHERSDAVVIVQMLLGGRRGRTHGAAHWTFPTVGGRALVMMRVGRVHRHLEQNVVLYDGFVMLCDRGRCAIRTSSNKDLMKPS